MKSIVILLTFCGVFITLNAQPNTEIFLFDLEANHSKIEIKNPKNISHNEGYDNQPSFLNDRYILFASTRNGQTDIVKYDTHNDSKIWINSTEGGEYTPLKNPKKNDISAVRLDKDGKQRLYSYTVSNGASTELIKDLVVAYYTWYDAYTIVSAVIEEDDLNLYITNLLDGKSRKYATSVGRSFHKIPNSDLVSYISKENEKQWQIKSLHPETGEIKVITNTLEGVEDICWLDENTILSGQGNTLYKFRLQKNINWEKVADLSHQNISQITRLATNDTNDKLLIAGDLNAPFDATSKEEKLEPKLENCAWIAGNWKGEAFGGQTEENWSEPSGGSMMATFKLINDGKVSFYEIEIIREIENSLVLQLKHFDNDLKGWETKNETVDFPLKEITKNRVIFEGMTFEKVNDNEMNVYVDIENKEGDIQIVTFNYKKE
ncbi:DUF6265 family protein [Psychroserpens mesophilus]|uniref:DUF6265 family protein n=1 Tax=Psychroserpens mesophilus TaxID=325473 RepID=UPI003D6554A8